LQNFVANLFNTLCTNFYQNRPCFVEDMTKNILAYFFLDTVYSVLVGDELLYIRDEEIWF